MIQDEHGCIDYDESGAGPTVVLVPGSCSTGAVWRPIISHWGNSVHCVTTSLLGYGRSTERRTAFDADISHEAEILETVIRRTGRPVHLIGHSFGGLTALAVALRNEVPLLSLAILEAPAPEILRNTGEHQHYRSFREMTKAYFAAFHAGESAAIERMIDFFGGVGTSPPGRSALATTRGNHGGQHSGLGKSLWLLSHACFAYDRHNANAGLVGQVQSFRRCSARMSFWVRACRTPLLPPSTVLPIS